MKNHVCFLVEFMKNPPVEEPAVIKFPSPRISQTRQKNPDRLVAELIHHNTELLEFVIQPGHTAFLCLPRSELWSYSRRG